MAYTAKKNAQGNYEIFQDGNRVSTGSASVLQNYGLSEANLGGAPAPVSTPTYTPPTSTVPASTPTPVDQTPVIKKVPLPDAVYTNYQDQIRSGAITPEAAASALQNIYAQGQFSDSFNAGKLYVPGLTYQNSGGVYKYDASGQPIKTTANVQQSVTTGGGTTSYTGPSLVDYLSSAGQPNDLNSRANLAVQLGYVKSPEEYIAMANAGTNGPINSKILTSLRLKQAGATDSHVSAINGSIDSGNVSPTGVPKNMSDIFGLGGLTPSSPIPTSGLGGGSMDLSSILGAGAGSGSNTNDSITQLLAMINSNTPEDNTYNNLNANLTSLMSSLGGESGDLTTALAANGVPEAQNALKQINLDIAGKKVALEKFDTETTTAKANIEDQAIPTGLIQGQTAALTKQRDLSKLAMASDLSASVSLAQAYQGNIDLGTSLAEQAVNMKYAPIENQIKVLQTQIGIAKDAMNTADSKKMNIINTLLSIRSGQVASDKKRETDILTAAVNAAANGAPLSVVNQMKAAGDVVSATVIGANWLKGNLEPVPKTPTPGSGDTVDHTVTPTTDGGQSIHTGNGSTVTTPGGQTYKFTSTQLNKGSSNAGLSSAEFLKLPGDVQNYFINNAASVKTLQTAISGIGDGTYTAQEVKDNIDGSVLSPAVKDYLKKLIDTKYPKTTQAASGGGVGNFFSNIWGTIKTGASDLLSRI